MMTSKQSFSFYDEIILDEEGIPTKGHWKPDGTLVVTPIDQNHGWTGDPIKNPPPKLPDDEGVDWAYFNAGHTNEQNVEKGKKFYPRGERQVNLLADGKVKEFYETLYPSLGELSSSQLREFLENAYKYNRRALTFNPKGYFDTDTGTRDIGLSTYPLFLEYGKAMHTNLDDLKSNPSPNDFMMTALMDIVALVYWIWGNGKTRRISAEALSLHWNQHDFIPISEILTSDPAPGKYSIDGRYAYNIFSDIRDLPQAFALGQIVGNVKGVLTIKQDNTYSFIGEAIIYSGEYDANKGAGDAFREAATDVLRAIGEVFGHTDYIIDTYGSVSLNFEGKL